MHRIITLCLLLAAASPALAQPYPEVQRSSFYVATRDGTRLAMDLYRPALNGRAVDTPLPVIWQGTVSRRLPPDQAPDTAMRTMPELARHGYVVALVDRRGAGSSFGARRGYNDRTEARDAFDVTEWLARQPWSTGKVGVYGCSNTGDAAMHAATLMPPSLKAVFAGCFSFSKYDGFLRGGILANWGSGVERRVEDDLRNPPVDGPEGPELLRQAVDDHRRNGPLAAMWRGMPFRDSWTDFTASRFWLEGSAGTYREAIVRSGVGVYIFGGFDDDFRREGLVAFANLAPLQRKLTLGPWTHCRNDGLDLRGEALRFFDHFLKGLDTGLMREPAVRYHVRGAPEAEAWRRSEQFPPAGGQPLSLALSPQGAGPAHALGGSARAATASLSVRAPRACGNENTSQATPCPQTGLGLQFTGEPLARDTELIGHPQLRLWLSANVPAPQVFAYLESVAPDGRVTVLGEGRLNASLRRTTRAPLDNLGLPWHRALEEAHQPLVNDQPVELHFAMLPVSVRVPAGHRLQLTVTGADPRQRQPPAAGQVLTVHADASRPSALTLPTMP
jgi:uncharacterized protein